MSLTAVLQNRGLTATVKDPAGGTMDHSLLQNRENADQHPMAAITGLTAALAEKLPATHADDRENPHGVTAEQVGARPDTWLPTAAQVGARAADWMPTAADVGAAPAGLVLGHYDLASIDEVNAKIVEIMQSMNNHTIAHFTWAGTGTNGISSGIPYNGNHWVVTIHKLHSSNYGLAWMETYGGAGLGYRARAVIANGVIGAWEWVNPPMTLGVEYRTTQRWEGKPVYWRTVNFGALPNNTYASASVSAISREKVLSIWGYMSNGSGEVRTVPYANSHSTMNGAVDLFTRTTGTESIAVMISTNFDASGWTAVLILRYTKSTD